MQSLGLFCCAPRPLIIGVQRGRGPPCPAALLRFQFYSIPCPSIFQVAFTIFGTVSSRSPAVSSNSTPALAETASPLLGLAWGLDLKAPGADVRAGACALISIQEKIRRRRADGDRGGTLTRPAPVAVVKGARRAFGGVSRRAGPALPARAFGSPKGGAALRAVGPNGPSGPRAKWRVNSRPAAGNCAGRIHRAAVGGSAALRMRRTPCGCFARALRSPKGEGGQGPPKPTRKGRSKSIFSQCTKIPPRSGGTQPRAQRSGSRLEARSSRMSAR